MPEWLLPVLVAPCAGSLLGVMIRRMPAERPIVFTRSMCESCSHPLAARDLVPLISFLALRGRCRNCRSVIASFHPAVELASLAIPLWAAAAGAEGAQLWASCLLGWLLLALAWIDWEHMRLPNALTQPLLLAGLGMIWLSDPPALPDHAIGAAAGYFAFRAIASVYRLMRNRDGLGLGDAKLLAAAGAWLGWQALPTIVLMAALGGIVMAMFRKRHGTALQAHTILPFGPSLAGAIWLYWLYCGSVLSA